MPDETPTSVPIPTSNTLPPISIKIKHREEQAGFSAGESARDDFWRPYINERKAFFKRNDRETPASETDILRLEEELRDRIPASLRRRLFEYIPGMSSDHSGRSSTQGFTPVGLFFIQVAEYSSLDLNLIVGGLDSLNKIFSSDLSLFRTFLDQYLPQAFAEATSSDFAAMMSYSVIIPTDYQAVFKPTPETQLPDASPPSDSPLGVSGLASLAQQNARWAWNVTNTSLVVPVLLALAVLFFCAGEERSMRADRAAAMKEERAQQAALITTLTDSQMQLLKKVADQQAESLKDERSHLFSLQKSEQQYILDQLKAKTGTASSASASARRVKPARHAAP